ncbi:MAG: PglZ domain-containing protein [Candidatus Thiodiazotropha sp.]
MRIKNYIKGLLRERLASSECLVLYDADVRYQELANELRDDQCHVIDASISTIQAREKATNLWLSLGKTPQGSKQLLIYAAVPKPLAEDERQRDPFQIFALGGDVFPRGEGDSYLSLCLQAKPDFQDKLYELFDSDSPPSFETIDALDSGSTWPKLRTLLGVESPREILIGFLSPTDGQKSELKADKSWLKEYRQFVKEILGLQSHINVGAWEDVRSELARFVLFSEFVLDLPAELPASLVDVPHADKNRRALIYAVCEHLRDARTHQDDYITLANEVVQQLELPARMKGEVDFGSRDTFLFEERAYLRRCAESADKGDLDAARTIVDQRRNSIWVQSEDRGAAWVIADRGLELLQAVADLETELSSVTKGLGPLITFYVDRGRRADTLHRNFERTVHDAYGQTEGLERLIESARRRHRAFSDTLQKRFLESVGSEGWPISGFTRHSQVFEKSLAPALEQHHKVALFMVDAMRYELAAEFVHRLPEGMKTTLQPALAQIPTITPVGMAALLPEADGKLQLVEEKGDLVPSINGTRVRIPAQRVEYVRGLYGDRVAALDLEDLLKTRKPKLKETVDLLLVKNTEIDTAGENMAGAALGIMRGVLEKFLRAVKVLQDMGFEQAVFASDHGFVLLSEQLPGDKVEKPQGSWLLAKVRCLAGSGAEGKGAVRFRKEDLGVHGDLEHLVVPESLGAFKTGATFMHSGVSLQECIIPVVTVDLGTPGATGKATGHLQLQYRAGKTDRITTRRPMVEVVLFQADMFGGESLQFSLEAKAGKKIVGQVAPNPNVDPATGLVTIEAGAAVKIPLRMEEDFEGEFTVTAIDPVTNVTFAKLKLQTDYVE